MGIKNTIDEMFINAMTNCFDYLFKTFGLVETILISLALYAIIRILIEYY